MMTKGRLAGLALAALVGGGLLAEPLASLAGMPAPLPVQIPIRDASEPPTPSYEAKPFVSSPARTHRKRTVRKRRAPARSRSARKSPTPPVATATATKSGPKLEQRQEAPTESIMSLDLLPTPDSLGPAGKGMPPAGAKPATGAGPEPKPATAPLPGATGGPGSTLAEPKPAPEPKPAEFPPKPENGAKPPAAPAKP
jgi:hypothetical protein